MEQATAGSYSELVKSAKADGRTLTPRAEWVKMGKNGYLPRSGAKWL
jgi:hypothetical protein